MSVLVTSGTYTIAPELVLSYVATRPSTTVVHDIIGTADPVVTLRPMGLRRGSIRLLFATRQAANSADYVLAQTRIFAYSDADNSPTNMSFVVEGDVTKEIAEPGSNAWTLTIAFREVRG